MLSLILGRLGMKVNGIPDEMLEILAIILSLSVSSATKEKGILYIEYLIESEFEQDPNKYLKRGQMEEYFNRKGWILFYCNEGDSLLREKPDLEHHEFHEHNVGRIKVMKDKNKKLDFYKVNLIF